MAITFDPTSKRIILDVTSISATEIYSRWLDWATLDDNVKYGLVFRQVGSDDLGSGLSIPPYFFLQNGWRVRPMESTHTLVITGNLFVEEGGTPVVPTLGSFNVMVQFTVPVQAQTVSVGGIGTVTEVRDAIWQATASNYTTVGSTGSKLNSAGSSGDPWSADLSSYTPGTAGHYLYNKVLSLAKFIGLK